MMFDCPTLAAARLQYYVVFGAHVEMKAAFTDPLPLLLHLHHLFITMSLPHPEMNTPRFS
jgi:hypothetical protein